jgi:hypothetical protein
MKYSTIFLGALLAGTTIALPSHLLANPRAAEQGLAERTTAIAENKAKPIARAIVRAAGHDTDTDSDGDNVCHPSLLNV